MKFSFKYNKHEVDMKKTNEPRKNKSTFTAYTK